MEEIWKDIDGFDGKYQISSLGRVRSVYSWGKKRGPRILRQFKRKGYAHICLLKLDGTRKNIRIHREVAKAFIPNPNNYEMVNHKDENPGNNCVDNLEWCTRSYNQIYSMNLHKDRRMIFARNFLDKNGNSKSTWTKKGVPHTRLERVRQSTYDGEFVKIHENASVAAKELGIESGNILGACRRNAWTDRKRKRKFKAGSGGFVWEYAD